MPESKLGKCRSCHAPVQWAKHKRTGRPNPLDVEPSPQGNNLLDQETMIYETLTNAELERARSLPHLRLFNSHFATCPNSRSHRKTKQPLHPEVLLASCDTMKEAQALASAISEEFHRQIYVASTRGQAPYTVTVSEELHPDVLAKVKQFVDEKRREVVTA